MEGCVYATFFGGPDQFLVLKGRLHNRKIGYGPVKNEQTGTDQWLFRFRGYRRLWPQYLKKHGSIPIPKNMIRIVYTSKNVRSVLLSRRVRTQFFCRVNGLSVSAPLHSLVNFLICFSLVFLPPDRGHVNCYEWVTTHGKCFEPLTAYIILKPKAPDLEYLACKILLKGLGHLKMSPRRTQVSDTDLQQFSTWESRLTTSFSFYIHISHIFATYTWSLRLLFRQCGCVALMKGYQTVEARKRYLKQSALLCMIH